MESNQMQDKYRHQIVMITRIHTVTQGLERGDPDPAFALLFRKNPASLTFFISIPNPVFLAQKNTLKNLISTKANKCRLALSIYILNLPLF